MNVPRVGNILALLVLVAVFVLFLVGRIAAQEAAIAAGLALAILL